MKLQSLSSQLYRHGDRSPVKAYPTDPYQDSSWPQGFGQLSQVHITSLKSLVFFLVLSQHFHLFVSLYK